MGWPRKIAVEPFSAIIGSFPPGAVGSLPESW
jgi:hypothetical protein